MIPLVCPCIFLICFITGFLGSCLAVAIEDMFLTWGLHLIHDFSSDPSNKQHHSLNKLCTEQIERTRSENCSGMDVSLDNTALNQKVHPGSMLIADEVSVSHIVSSSIPSFRQAVACIRIQWHTAKFSNSILFLLKLPVSHDVSQSHATLARSQSLVAGRRQYAHNPSLLPLSFHMPCLSDLRAAVTRSELFSEQDMMHDPPSSGQPAAYDVIYEFSLSESQRGFVAMNLPAS